VRSSSGGLRNARARHLAQARGAPAVFFEARPLSGSHG
jgi:hypothetical protein